MGKVLRADASIADAYVEFIPASPQPESWLTFDAYFPPAPLAAWLSSGLGFSVMLVSFDSSDQLWLANNAVGPHTWQGITDPPEGGDLPAPDSDGYHTFELHYDNGAVSEFFIDGSTVWSIAPAFSADTLALYLGLQTSDPPTGPAYFKNVIWGTTRGGSDIFAPDFSSGDLSAWSATSGDVSVVDDPLATSVSPMDPGRRVGIAFDDGPLEPNPTWAWLDDDTVFPAQFVAGYDTKNGRQTLISQTETGTATVYINDRAGLFDDRNLSSPYTGKLSGRQIILQLWNPVTEVWEPQFRGLIDDYHYDIDGSAVDANGDPINASVQLECVDIFDYLNGYGLTPGLDGVTPPAGMEDGVWYAPTSGGVSDRFFEILTDATSSGWVAARALISSGNVNVIGVKYDPDESALSALRDAADAELPFIANIYVNRYGQFVFRGRYARFDPDGVSSEPLSTWDFNRWPLGDGKAIQADPTRGQIRAISYVRSRANLINAALAYPQDIAPEDMPGQVYASTASITAQGKHAAPPMGNLLTCEPTVSGYDKLTETAKFAELLVENKKAPRLELTQLQLKSMRPDDPRAAATWGAICGADISHIVNVAVGYPGGTGLEGNSPSDDHYVEGRSLTVRPLNPVHDYVECDLETSPALWSMDANGVFPAFS